MHVLISRKKNKNLRHLHEVSYIDQQRVGLGWNIVPLAISKNLQCTKIIVHEKSREDAVVGVRLEAKDKIGSRAGKVVVDSYSYRCPAAELVKEVIVVQIQKPGHRPENYAFYFLAFRRVLE